MNINNTAQAIQQQRQTPKSQALKNRKPLVSTLFSQPGHLCTLREAPGSSETTIYSNDWERTERAASEQKLNEATRKNLLELRDKEVSQTQAQDM